MAFPPGFLEELRARLPLAGVVGRVVRLVRRGREHSGLCPFHNEKTPSFTVNEEKGFFHCFGCGAHGDVIAFEMRTRQLSFPEAVERLAGEAGLEVPRASPEERARAKRHATLHEVMEAACAFYERQLAAPAGRAALAYLKERGLEDATIARFRLGFAPDGRTALKAALDGAGIPQALQIEAGLLIEPDRGEPYDRFRGRVIFPITDRRGRVIAFGGRIMGEGQPKYLNSPDTPLFHKGAVLYGLAQARQAAVEAGTVIVAEGYMDVIALSQAGFRNAVAPLGTALTEQQIEELWRLVPEPTLCFDGDTAGQRAAGRAALRALPILKPGQSLRFALVPPPEDPDSLIRKQGPQAMTALLHRAEPLFEVLWRLEAAGRPVETPERRAALERDLFDRAREIGDTVVRQQYERMLRERLWETWRQARPPFPGAAGKARRRLTAAPPPPPEAGDSLRERILLATLINHPALFDQVGERLGGLDFADGALDKLRQAVIKHLATDGNLDSAATERHLRSCGFAQTVDSLLGARVYGHASFARPGASIELARAGWEETFKLYLQKDLKADVTRAEERLARDMSSESLDLFLALKALEQTAVAEDGEAPDPPGAGGGPARPR